MLVRIPKLIHSYIGANFSMAPLDEFFSLACFTVSGGNWLDWFRDSVAVLNVWYRIIQVDRTSLPVLMIGWSR